MKILYEAPATVIGGRSGSAASADGTLRVRLAQPEVLGGPGGEGTNPEQLFATGFAACFLSAIRKAAGERGVELASDSNVTATVGLGERDDGTGLGLRVALSIDLPGVDEDEATAIVAAAEQFCAYSHATRGNVGLSIDIA